MVRFLLNFYSVFRDLSRRSSMEPVFDGSATRFKFLKFAPENAILVCYVSLILIS